MLIDYQKVLTQAEPGLRFVTISQVQGKVPFWWIEALSKSGADQRVAACLTNWKLVISDQLPQTFNTLLDHCFDIAVVNIGQHYYLLYGLAFDTHAGFYLGGNPEPLAGRSPGDLGWDLMPEHMEDFYTKLHDGFFEFGNYRLGPLPIRMFQHISRLFVVFTSGLGAYVGIDPRQDADRNKATLQLHACQPEQTDFWPIIDQWTELGMSGG